MNKVHKKFTFIQKMVNSPCVSCTLQFGSKCDAERIPISLVPFYPQQLTAMHRSLHQWLWPIPESSVVHRYTNYLIRRHAHPKLTVGLRNDEILTNGKPYNPPSSVLLADTLQIAKDINFPYNSYSVEVGESGNLEFDSNHDVSATAVYALRQWVDSSLNGTEGGISVKWSAVYVWEETGIDSQEKVGETSPMLCGMVRARRLGESFDDDRIGVEMLLFPHQFCSLLPLIKRGAEITAASQSQGNGTVHFSQHWQQDMNKYMSAVPAHTYPALVLAMKPYHLDNCVPRNNIIPMFGKILRRRLERLNDVCRADLTRMQGALYENKRMWQCPQLADLRRFHAHTEVNGGNLLSSPQESFERESLFSANTSRSVRCADRHLNVTDVFTASSGRKHHTHHHHHHHTQSADGISHIVTPSESPFVRPLHNGCPDVTPWPTTVLASYKGLNAGNIGAPQELIAVETCDLLHTWEVLRKTLYGGGGSLATRGVTLDGVTGSGGRLNNRTPSPRPYTGEYENHLHTEKKRNGLKRDHDLAFDLNNDTTTEMGWWFRACGASRVPILTVGFVYVKLSVHYFTTSVAVFCTLACFYTLKLF